MTTDSRSLANLRSDDLRSFASRINNLLDEKQALSADVTGVYDEAKKAGVNTKALRKVIAKRRAKTPDPAVEAAMEAYEHALDEAASMVSNGSTSLRKASVAMGFSKSSIQRRVMSHRKENAGSGTEHDPETGEIAAGAGEVPSGRDAPSDEHSKPRSLTLSASDSTEPVEPTGNEGWVGERGTAGSATGNQAQGEGDGRILEGSNDRGGNGLGAVDGNGHAFPHDGRESLEASHQSRSAREPAGSIRAAAAAPKQCGVDQPGTGAAVGHLVVPAVHGGDHVRRSEPAGRDLQSVERTALATGEGTAPTPPLGAVAEGDSPQRVAQYPKGLGPDDPLEIPHFLKRVVAPPQKAPQLDERAEEAPQ